MKWSPCSNPAVADIIRWNEPLWAPPTKKRGKPDSIGEQRITAKIVAIGDYLQLQVQVVEQLSLNEGADASAMKVQAGDSIKRKRSTLDLGDCHRLSASEA